MYKFDLLTRHIPELQSGNRDEADGSRLNSGRAGRTETPTPMSRRDYSDAVNALYHDIYEFCEVHPEYDSADYRAILEENGLEWELDSMSNADVSKLDAKAIIALFIGASRAERFCDGILMEFLENGAFVRWLKRLEELDESNSDTSNSSPALEADGRTKKGNGKIVRNFFRFFEKKA